MLKAEVRRKLIRYLEESTKDRRYFKFIRSDNIVSTKTWIPTRDPKLGIVSFVDFLNNRIMIEGLTGRYNKKKWCKLSKISHFYNPPILIPKLQQILLDGHSGESSYDWLLNIISVGDKLKLDEDLIKILTLRRHSLRFIQSFEDDCYKYNVSSLCYGENLERWYTIADIFWAEPSVIVTSPHLKFPVKVPLLLFQSHQKVEKEEEFESKGDVIDLKMNVLKPIL